MRVLRIGNARDNPMAFKQYCNLYRATPWRDLKMDGHSLPCW